LGERNSRGERGVFLREMKLGSDISFARGDVEDQADGIAEADDDAVSITYREGEDGEIAFRRRESVCERERGR